ncbi:MAG TPA: ATP-binding protein [Chromatiales bacterium]|nr:ATP-binding protein [Chromatiales bacterium]
MVRRAGPERPAAGAGGGVLPRHAAGLLARSLRVMPVTVVTGARQTGKTTLVGRLVPGRRRMVSLDDLDALDLARSDPEALLGGGRQLTLDEVQRAPQLLHAVKRLVDRDRRPGRFLLTGSANLLLMRRVSESLAGRAAYLTLWPMARGELLGEGRAGAWDLLLREPPQAWPDALARRGAPPGDWRELARRGGFPVPALELRSASDRRLWFEGYVRSYLERDLLELSSVGSLPDFRRLMRAVCLQVGQMLNQSALGRALGLPQPTVHRWLNLLEASYLLVRLPAYAANRRKRLVRSPKAYWADTGLALHLAGAGRPDGPHLENLVLHDLLVWRDGHEERVELAYWRTVTGEEVDFVIERSGTTLAVEVKAATRPRLRDAAGLLAFRREHGGRVHGALLLHGGRELAWLAEGVLAAPWWMVL